LPLEEAAGDVDGQHLVDGACRRLRTLHRVILSGTGNSQTLDTSDQQPFDSNIK
jgi:hypothetical protein